MSITEDDLMLVNALHDGELDDKTAAELRARIEIEPELREALQGVREVSESLKALRPPDSPAFQKASLARRWKIAVAAAFVAAAVLSGISMVVISKDPETPLEWHRHFLAQSYGTGGTLQPSPATKWIGQEPDLTAARLTLVDIACKASGEVYLHYSGVNGCRLTFGTHDTVAELPSSSRELACQPRCRFTK